MRKGRKGKLLAKGKTKKIWQNIYVVVRRIATGPYLKRYPDVVEGTRFTTLVVEFFDKWHNTLVIYDFVGRHVLFYDAKRPFADGFLGKLSMEVPYEVLGWMLKLLALAEQTFLVLEEAWAAQNVTLVNLKIECGKDANGEIVVGDVIMNYE